MSLHILRRPGGPAPGWVRTGPPRRRRPATSRRRLFLEPLEDRTVLSASTAFLVDDINTTARSSAPQNLVNVNGTLFFSADGGPQGRELWKSDGTAAGTVLVKDIVPGGTGSNPYQLTAAGGTLFFTADDGVHGRELWKSDGTAAGTVLVKDINPGAEGSFLVNLTVVNGTLFFGIINLASSSAAIWKVDGTEAGAVLVKEDRKSVV